ncbi:MAG TPA: penicillin-binding protein 2 [Geminicoccus sp.]|jgi:cell division protein FtsI (penicillin-binding protein 3)|uniref:peptidoglycan D,D-transpeptidase FtsI family protein n=1 Tax=Geminicoccus sp. TaxID=2024832 RepID=UPI002E310012|nr:penicillin-binding protein 2 [Geminicoccus sp.]HEX2527023.1 penicillin-binding protein 2 [Geminicoccus sp.]
MRTSGGEGGVALARRRIGVLLATFGLLFSTLAFRLVDITQLAGAQEEASRYVRPQDGISRRDVVDRHGVPLATDVTVSGVGADPRDVPKDQTTIGSIAAVLGRDPRIIERILDSDRHFVWLERRISPRQQAALLSLGVPGLEFREQPRRVYPQASLVAHLIGQTGVDNGGLSGIEQRFDRTIRTDVSSRDREPFALSIDLRIQQVLREELMAGIRTYEARAANGMIMDVRTGEMLAMVSLPDFDANRPIGPEDLRRSNRNTEGVYEVGSLFKTLTLATLMDAGVVKMNDMWDATKRLQIGRRSIGDSHPLKRWASTTDVFINSSNIGTARMALAGGADLQREYLEKLRLLEKPQLEVPGVSSPLIPRRWPDITVAVVSYGQTLAITPLSFLNAFSAVVNGGVLRPATLLRRDSSQPLPGERVISEKASAQIRELLWLNVVDGTGTKARVPGMMVGGKTGTADKPINGRYIKGNVIASFVAAFPMNEPRYAILVMLDNPTANAASMGFRYGSWNAAPVTGRVISRTAPLLGVPLVPQTVEDEFLAAAPAEIREKELTRRIKEARVAALEPM